MPKYRPCEICGATVRYSDWQDAIGHGRFCSKSCSSKGQKGKRKKGKLYHLTREQLEPIWNRREIPIRKMAAALGVSREGIAYHARRMGLPSRANNQEPAKKCPDDLFIRMWNAGVTSDEIRKHCGYADRSGVNNRRTALGLAPRTRPGGTGHHGGWAMITIDQFWEMELARMMQDAA